VKDMPECDYWEKAFESGEYKHWEFNYPSPELVALAAAGVPPKGSRVLDVGCGGGIDAIFMANCGFKVIGIDISATALRIARKREKKAHVNVDWQRASVLELPINNESIDLVTDRGLFHLVEDPDRSVYSAEIYRILKKGGHALIRGASKESGHNQFNPVSEEAINKYFSASKFKSGLVLPIPLFSVEGVMDGRIVMLQKIGLVQ
jgi:ubiquinone/menaquinone biosynthesis C-methylase UbiE